jgi:hypothetical protein
MSHPPPTLREVAATLEALRIEVRAQRQRRGGLVPGPLESELRRTLDEIELHRVVSAHWPLTARSLPGRALNLINKVVRFSLRWYINPIVAQQNAYNDAVARALRLLADAYGELAEQVGETIADSRYPIADNNAAPVEQLAPDAEPHRRGEADCTTPVADVAPLHAPTGLADAPDAPTSHAALMALVRERGAAEPPARLLDLELRGVEATLRERESVGAHWPLIGETSLGRVVTLVQRGMRQYLRWLINPIVEQQNAANAAVTATILTMLRVDAERRAEVAARRANRRNEPTA